MVVRTFRNHAPSQAAQAAAHFASNLIRNDAVSTLPVRRRLSEALATESPVAIDGVRNVWCCSASVGKKFALLNIVTTRQ